MDDTDDDFFGEQGPSNEAALREQHWESIRREHVNAGFREGSELGHEAEMQSGFDAGFLAGAQATSAAGFWYACTLPGGASLANRRATL